MNLPDAPDPREDPLDPPPQVPGEGERPDPGQAGDPIPPRRDDDEEMPGQLS